MGQTDSRRLVLPNRRFIARTIDSKQRRRAAALNCDDA